jgi:formylglycine-generating enzyme required for sulfatase activity
MRARATLAATVAACAACAQTPPTIPWGQILLYVETDAPLPGAGPGAPPPLFDRVRIDVLPPGQSTPCDGCSNDLALTTAKVASRDASVGLIPTRGVPGYRARVRMYVSAFANALGEPDPDSTVDSTFALPATGEDWIVELTAPMRTDAVGLPQGTPDAPIEPTPGRPTASAVVSWPGATSVPCVGSQRAGEVCVPGAAFWFGTTKPELPHGDAFLSLRPRLVTLSPFWIGDREVTVAAYQASGLAAADTWSGTLAGDSWQDWCTFRGPNVDQPLNCIRWADARAYCQSIGADLPTEAQLEYVAGGEQGSRFVWGAEDPTCSDAIFGQGGYGYWSFYNNVCTPAVPGAAPLPVSSGGRGRDRLVLPDGSVIYDLAGNLEEWTRDDWNAPDDPCWARPGVYADPWCQQVSPSNDFGWTLRGGGWIDSGDMLLATARSSGGPFNSANGDQEEPVVGFRCVRADAP